VTNVGDGQTNHVIADDFGFGGCVQNCDAEEEE
jgi:hypothetical protein